MMRAARAMMMRYEIYEMMSGAGRFAYCPTSRRITHHTGDAIRAIRRMRRRVSLVRRVDFLGCE